MFSDTKVTHKASWRRKLGALSAATAVVALGVVSSGPALADPNPSPRNSIPGNCMPLFPDNPLGIHGEGGTPAPWTDNNPNVYVSEDAQFLNHEGEGLVIVGGDLLVRPPADYPWAFQLGAGAGGGSGNWPVAQALMLAVGGDLEANDPGLNIGLFERPGKWYVGGEATGNIRFESVWSPEVGEWGGQLQLRVDSVAGTPADGYRARLDEFQAVLLDQAPNGSASVAAAGAGLVLKGDGTSPLQTFELGAQHFAQLNTELESRIDFTDIPENATIMLRATDGADVKLTGSVRFSMNGTDIEMADGDWEEWGSQRLAAWGNLTQRLLWHFPTQSSVTIGVEDNLHHQFTGSVFAGKVGADLYANASTNGRIISYGTFTAGEGHGADLGRMEFHSFPFHFPGALSCDGNEVASFALNKLLVDEDGEPFSEAELEAFQQAGTSFEVEVAWTADDGEEKTAKVQMSADGERVPGPQDILLPTEGKVAVTFSEVRVLNPPEGFIFEGAEFASGEKRGNPLTVEVDSTDVVNVSLTNKYSRDSQGEGSFGLRKIVDHPLNGGELADAVFGVKASWTVDGQSHSELFELKGDGTLVASEHHLPVGTVVTFEETSAPATPEGWEFEGVTFSPERLTISANIVTAVTATNTYTDSGPGPEVGGFSLGKALCCPELLGSLTGGTFVVEASWMEGGEAKSETFDLKGNGVVVDGPQDLPVGTKVTFEEISMPDDPQGWVFEGAKFSPEELVIGAGTSTVVTATNFYSKTATFQVAKKFGGGVAPSDFGTDARFAVDVTWTPEGEGQIPISERLQLNADGTPTKFSRQLPAGTKITFSEPEMPDAPQGWTFAGVTFEPEELVVGEEHDATVVATNNYVSAGTFKVAKRLAGGIQENHFATGTQFPVEASWEDASGDTVTETLHLPVDGSEVQSKHQLPINTVVSFKEIGAPNVKGWNFEGVTFDPASLVIGTGEPALVTATNTYSKNEAEADTGTFKVRKIVEGIDEDLAHEVDFEINASWEGGSVTLNVPGDGTPVESGVELPVGTKVAFAEQAAPDFPGTTWKEVVFSNDEIVIDGQKISTVTAKNIYTPSGTPEGETPEGETPEGETPEESGQSGGLASTGVAGAVAVGLLGGSVLLAGVFLLIRPRRS